jgi:outer membrane protein OmpA-like peptidoglycan-associated protein
MKQIWILLLSVLLLSACATQEEVTFRYGEGATDLADEDNDGVPNERDLCGGTQAGIKVSHDGCAFWEQVEGVKDAVVLFGFDSDQVRAEHMEDIKAVVAYVADHDDAFILIEGSTSAVGDETYNMQLQARRSAAVKELLLAEGAAADKIRVHSQGSMSGRLETAESPAAEALNQRVFIRAVRAEQSMQKKWTIYSSEEQQ